MDLFNQNMEIQRQLQQIKQQANIEDNQKIESLLKESMISSNKNT